jgi:hypothetical protein
MKEFIKYIALITLIFFSACKVSKDIEKPQPALPAAFRDASTTDAASIADIGWKQFFADQTLQNLIDSAIVNNYDMQYALKNIESAQLILKQTKYAYLPDANLNVTGGITRPSDNSLNGISCQYQSFMGSRHLGKNKRTKSNCISSIPANCRSTKSNTNKHCSQHRTIVLQSLNAR